MFNNPFVAIINSTLRVLRCNQLFRGGIDYPIVKIDFKKPSFTHLSKMCQEVKDVSYWFVPIDKDKYYVIKKFKDIDDR